MKKIINKIGLLSASLVMLWGCSDADNVVYDVFDGQSYGAVLRTTATTSTSFNIFDLNSTFDIQIEEQDEKYGDLLEKVIVYASYVDKHADGIDNNKPDTVVKTLNASDFTKSANGLPTANVKTTLGEVVTALGLAVGQYTGGDDIIFRLALHLTDGRIFSSESTSGSVQGSYFKSPYAYKSTILCIPPAAIAGDYTLVLRDNYGDGWQGGGIVVDIDGTSTKYSIPSYWDAPAATRGSVGDPQWSTKSFVVTVPVGTIKMTMSWVEDNYQGEAEMDIKGPKGSLLFTAAAGPSAGELPLNLCQE